LVINLLTSLQLYY